MQLKRWKAVLTLSSNMEDKIRNILGFRFEHKVRIEMSENNTKENLISYRISWKHVSEFWYFTLSSKVQVSNVCRFQSFIRRTIFVICCAKRKAYWSFLSLCQCRICLTERFEQLIKKNSRWGSHYLVDETAMRLQRHEQKHYWFQFSYVKKELKNWLQNLRINRNR